MKQKRPLALTLKALAAIKNIAKTKPPPIHPTASATAKQGSQSGHATLSPLQQVVISSTEWAQAALQSFDAVVQPPRDFAALPAIADGRTARLAAGRRASAKFQSTPVIADWRTPPRPSLAPPGHRFNPRPSSLTGEPERASPRGCYCRFNPRPSSLTGEPICSPLPGQGASWFQSTPVIADGRTVVDPSTAPVTVFQSTPVIADGRTGHECPRCAFNDVSIHARHR